MSSSKNLDQKNTSFLTKSNSTFIENMYIRYIEKDPNLPLSWRDYFETLNDDINSVIKDLEGPTWQPQKKKIKYQSSRSSSEHFSNEDLELGKSESIKAIALIRAYRIRGHLIANLDPLNMMERNYLYELHPEDHGFKKEDYDKKIYLGSYLDSGYASINEILTRLRKIYCSTIGAEYMHITDPAEKVWFRDRMEKEENKLNFTDNGKKAILNKIVQAEGFEKFLAKKYVGTKRFGLDGGESLIPALEQIIKRGGQLGVKEVKIGMPHRGRLNVLANVLQKSYKRIFNEFAGEENYTKAEDSGRRCKISPWGIIR